MLIAVTGGMGFIGQEVISRLETRHHKVILVDFWEDILPRYEANKFPILESVYRNGSTAESFKEPWNFLGWLKSNSLDAVIHFGAVADTSNMGGSGDMFRKNIWFTEQLVRTLNVGRATTDVPGIVFASSAAVYGSDGFPNNPYGMTKCLGEKMIKETRGDFLCARLFNVFGANEHHKKDMASVPFKLSQAYRDGRKFDMHSLDSCRDFVPVTTVANSIVEHVERMKNQNLDDRHSKITKTADLGTGVATRFADIDAYVMQATKQYTSCVRHVSIPSSLADRYQHYTCAGERVCNIGFGSQSTRDAIEEIYA